MKITPLPLIAATALLLVELSPPVKAQSAENVLLVLNESSPISLDIGRYYAEKRGIPAGNVLRIKTAVEESLPVIDFQREIEAPIGSYLARNSAQDRILYIVLTKGIPLRVEGTSAPDGTVASVDSELTLLYRKMTGQQVPAPGFVQNPYFLSDVSVRQAPLFSRDQYDLYLVTRLDGYTFEDIRGLIDRGFAPGREGKILLDEKESLQDKGNVWLRSAADVLRDLGFGDRVVLETTSQVLTGEENVLGYYSWGSNDPAIKIRDFKLGFRPGALAGMFVSSDGRSFKEPPADWSIGTWEDKTTHFAGSPQSMAGDLIRQGVTGVAGHVAEPYLEATVRPNILFPAYLLGHNLAEAYYLAMPYLSWQTVVIGDPLCAPFRSRNLTTEQIDQGIDPETELPRILSQRRLRLLAVTAFRQAGILPDTLKLVMRAEVRLSKGDQPGAIGFLEAATRKDSRLLAAHLLLGTMYETNAEYDKAIERYRLVLQSQPENPVALNNLAYALGVRKNRLKEALPLAEKAYAAAKGNPNIADTLAWIHFLMGDKDKARIFIDEALKSGENNSDLQMHAARIYAEQGEVLAAQKYLERALSLAPDLADSEEVRQLREKLRGTPP